MLYSYPEVNFFATLQQPLDRILPIPELRGARVLEIGCGMGLHTQTSSRWSGGNRN